MTTNRPVPGSWYWPARRPSLTAACRLLELSRCPTTRDDLRRTMKGWRSCPSGEPWIAGVATLEGWHSYLQCRAAYEWLMEQLPPAPHPTEPSPRP